MRIGIKLTQKKVIKRLIDVLTVCIFSSFIIFETYMWGKLVIFGGTLMVYLLHSLFLDAKSFKIRIDPYQKRFGVFILFCFFSIVWAINRSAALTMSMTLLQLFVLFTMLYVHYVDNSDVWDLIHIVLWSSYAISIYTIMFYGLGNLMNASQAEANRLGNDFTNINTVGMLSALGLLIQADEWIYSKKIKFRDLLCIPLIAVLAASQSRKAIMFLGVGIIVDYLLKVRKDKNKIVSFFKLLLFAALGIAAVIAISKMEMFAGISKRMEGLFAMLTGQGKIDSSTFKRKQMIVYGIDWWKNRPVLGYGIGCPRILNQAILGFNAYLHNNYVELLVALGLIGTILYYSIYVWLLYRFWKMRDVYPRYSNFAVLWIFLILAMDYGMVSYYSKEHCFYVMALFIMERHLRRMIKSQKRGNEV